MKIIEENPGVTRKELSVILEITTDGVKYHLQNMVREGIIKREGSDRSGKWVVL
ncbi:MAG: winged helix-turn-helix transcriptional regulator [Mediterranea sp.]|nr:winged helix-turn-helix transcriptional regulator [Mediterranea sp.]